MIRSVLKAALLSAATIAALVPTSPAQAQKKPKEEAPAKLDLDRLKKQLESSQPAEIRAAVATIQAAGDGGKAAAPLLEAFLGRGSTAELLSLVLKTTGSLRQISSSQAIAPYARHRISKVRREAVKALLKTKGPVAVRALRRALRSKDALVRGVAASGLGELGAKEALPDLFVAFDHRVHEAATSIGQMCAPADCEKFLDRLTRFPFDVMSGGLDQILFRSPKELDDGEKMKIVGRLRELGTVEAGTFLADVAERWPDDWSADVKKAIQQAAKQSGGGGEN